MLRVGDDVCWLPHMVAPRTAEVGGPPAVPPSDDNWLIMTADDNDSGCNKIAIVVTIVVDNDSLCVGSKNRNWNLVPVYWAHKVGP